jgi:hypothetical protein
MQRQYKDHSYDRYWRDLNDVVRRPIWATLANNSGKPRRFCTSCGRLRRCFYARVERGHRCTDCLKRENILPFRDAFGEVVAQHAQPKDVKPRQDARTPSRERKLEAEVARLRALLAQNSTVPLAPLTARQYT